MEIQKNPCHAIKPPQPNSECDFVKLRTEVPKIFNFLEQYGDILNLMGRIVQSPHLVMRETKTR